jgi:hypothetical protein
MQLPFQIHQCTLNAFRNYATIADASDGEIQRIRCRVGCDLIAVTP